MNTIFSDTSDNPRIVYGSLNRNLFSYASKNISFKLICTVLTRTKTRFDLTSNNVNTVLFSHAFKNRSRKDIFQLDYENNSF